MVTGHTVAHQLDRSDRSFLNDSERTLSRRILFHDLPALGPTDHTLGWLSYINNKSLHNEIAIN